MTVPTTPDRDVSVVATLALMMATLEAADRSNPAVGGIAEPEMYATRAVELMAAANRIVRQARKPAAPEAAPEQRESPEGEQRRPPQNAPSQGSTSGARSATEPAASGDEPQCPKCGGRVWDNRLTKRNPKAPDYKCRDRDCEGVIWPPKGGASRGGPKQPHHFGGSEEY